MKILTKLFDPRGLKPWILVLGLVLNLVLTGLFFRAITIVVIQQGETVEGLDTALMLGIFLITILIGFVTALLAKDLRGPTYGVYGGLVSFIMVTVIMYQSGALTLLVALMALLGGYNGGILGERINLNRK